jgi:hypothetical protein
MEELKAQYQYQVPVLARVALTLNTECSSRCEIVTGVIKAFEIRDTVIHEPHLVS